MVRIYEYDQLVPVQPCDQGFERSKTSSLKRRQRARICHETSVKIRFLQQDGRPSNKSNKNHAFLSITPTSTFAFVITIMYAYAWLVSTSVVASSLTAGLIQSAHETISSIKEDQQIFQATLNEIRTETSIAKQNLLGFCNIMVMEDFLHNDDELCVLSSHT